MMVKDFVNDELFHLPRYKLQIALALIGSTLRLPICSLGSQGWVGKVSNALTSCLHLLLS